MRIDVVTIRPNGNVTTNSIEITEQRTERLTTAVGNVRQWLSQTITSTIKADRIAREQAAYDNAIRAARDAHRAQSALIEAEE